jgi:endonuclease/exonuclease/phosphatase family metal-dependent hydrolase
MGWLVPGAVAESQPIASMEGRPEAHAANAYRVIGRMAFVSGTVERIVHRGRVHIMEFADGGVHGFEGVVFDQYMDEFPKSLEELYAKKTVRLHGVVDTFRGKPQIRLTSPDQAELIDSLPPERLPGQINTTAKATVTVATYNLLNLFDTVDDPYHQDETTAPKPREQLEALAKVIRQLDADVIGLQEVESRDYLDRFLEVFLPDEGYQVVHFEGNDIRGIDVCVISRVPVGEVRSHRHLTFDGPEGPMRFERDLLAVEILPPGGDPFELWVVHLKSNYEGREYAEPVRVAEAKMVRRMLDRRLKADPKARIILCGDMNDTGESETIKTLMGAGETGMKCFASELGDQPMITYNRPPYLTMIDFVMCTPAMADQHVKDSYAILSGDLMTQASDHNPVRARFRVKSEAAGKLAKESAK